MIHNDTHKCDIVIPWRFGPRGCRVSLCFVVAGIGDAGEGGRVGIYYLIPRKELQTDEVHQVRLAVC